MSQPLEVPTLHGPDVLLRPHTMDDLVPVLERCLDPQSVRWTVIPTPYTEQMAHDYLASVIEGSPYQVSWAIEKDGQYAGTIDIRSSGGQREHAAGDLGYVAHARARGQGVMTQAASLAIDHAFGALGWKRIVWQANVGNIGSYKPMWRNGFPQPMAVPALLNQRGAMVDGWHSVLTPDMPRTPAIPWADSLAGLQRDIEASHANRLGYRQVEALRRQTT